eukprot:gene13514-biopygen3521
MRRRRHRKEENAGMKNAAPQAPPEKKRKHDIFGFTRVSRQTEANRTEPHRKNTKLTPPIRTNQTRLGPDLWQGTARKLAPEAPAKIENRRQRPGECRGKMRRSHRGTLKNDTKSQKTARRQPGPWEKRPRTRPFLQNLSCGTRPGPRPFSPDKTP